VVAGKAKRVRDGLYRCHACNNQFSVTVGTALEGTHLSMRQWVVALFLVIRYKESLSKRRLQRLLRIGSYRSASRTYDLISRFAINDKCDSKFDTLDPIISSIDVDNLRRPHIKLLYRHLNREKLALPLPRLWYRIATPIEM
jgi:hypothetical protein